MKRILLAAIVAVCCMTAGAFEKWFMRVPDELGAREGSAGLSALKSAGKGFGKGEARELERLVKAREYYGKLYETYNAIGKHKLPPEKWDEEIRLMTGGEGILGSINNMGDLFKSLVFK